MNPLEVLLRAVLLALNTPALSYDGVAVPVRQHVTGNTSKHYVLLDQPTDNDLPGSAACLGYDCTVLLDVVTQFGRDEITSLPAESIVTQIHERLRGKRLALPAGWSCGPGQLSPGIQLRELVGKELALRRPLRYRWQLYYSPAVSGYGTERGRAGHETSTSYNPQSYA